ncbi:MAG: DUF6114 domain-containing protein [Candidatus Marsarchaeota archaeon]|nr:DUF6114 domain-containing protein [Candidatus Marsarchaeota archaeon]MCL5106232.1 DUF6114 domain-containing protein [Candidatus Marsarchaeota archaeon]
MAKSKRIKKEDRKPMAAFVLVLVGGIFVLLSGVMLSLMGSIMTFFIMGVGGIFGIIGIVSGIMMIISAAMINTTHKAQIKTWSVIALIFSVVSIANFGGFIIGFLFGLIGSILGLVFEK